MNHSSLLRIIAFGFSLLAITLSLSAGTPVNPTGGHSFEKAAATTPLVVGEASQAEAITHGSEAATVFILGFTLLLLVPVGLEYFAPKTLKSLFSHRRASLNHRVLP